MTRPSASSQLVRLRGGSADNPDLAAFGSADDKRRENYEELMRGLTFSRAESDTPAFDGPGQGTTATPGDSDYLVSVILCLS